MSFYGSVYYQLIDTFYKIIVKNSGNKTYDFNTTLVNPEGTPSTDLVESPAIGRKGIFSLDSGNYWINFSKTSNTEEAAPYKIWHSPANTQPTEILPVGGLTVETDKYIITKDTAGNEISIVDKEGNELIEGENYVQLQDHEFIRTYNTQYDEAGHVIDEKTESILYRLPKANVNERVDRMETILGQPSEGLEFPRPDLPAMEIDDLPQGEEYEGEVILSVTDYAEKNFEDIKRLERFVGDWEQSHNYYYDHNPSITEWIGDLDLLYGENGEYGISDNKEDTLVGIIGDLPKMRQLYENVDTISISDVFDANKKSMDEQFLSADKRITAAQDGINSLFFIVGDSADRAKIYEEIDAINADIININEDIDKIDDSIININETIGNKGTNKAIYTEIDDLQTIIGDQNDNNSVYEEIRKINNTIGSQDTKKAVYEEINNLQSTIGDQGEKDSVYEEINSINVTIGDQGTKNSVYEEIDSIKNIIGNQSDKNSVYEELNNLETSVSAINTTIGNKGEKGAIYHELGLIDTAIEAANTKIDSHINTANSALQSINGEIEGLWDECDKLSNSVWSAIGIEDPAPTESINTRIKNLESLIGEDEDVQNTLVEQIQTISQNIGNEETKDTILYRIANVETIIGNKESFTGTLVQHIEDVEALIGSKDSSEKTIIERLGAVETTTTTLSGLDPAVTANTVAIEAINKSISPLEQTISTLNTAIGDTAQLTEGQTILNLLSYLSKQIEGIKIKINELHPGQAEDYSDYPFPDVISFIPESE